MSDILNKKYKDYCANCQDDGIKPMTYEKWVKNHNPNPDELPRWKGAKTAPTLWDKVRKDPVFNFTLRNRVGDDAIPTRENPSMGYRK